MKKIFTLLACMLVGATSVSFADESQGMGSMEDQAQAAVQTESKSAQKMVKKHKHHAKHEMKKMKKHHHHKMKKMEKEKMDMDKDMSEDHS